MNAITTFSHDDIEVSIGDRLVIDGDVHTVARIAGRWVTLSNGANVSRADAAAAREEYLEDEEILGEEIENEEEGEEAAEEEAAEEESKDIVDNKYRLVYVKTKSVNGNRSYDRGDELAEILRGWELSQILNLCYALLPEKVGRWDHLNIGQRSMNARNAIRNAIKSGAFNLDDVILIALKMN